LRADSTETRNKWIEAIEAYKHYIDSAYGSENSLRRHESALSLSSLSVSSNKKGSRGLIEKVAEVETYRDILCRQIDSLQSFLDSLASNSTLIYQVPLLASGMTHIFMTNTSLINACVNCHVIVVQVLFVFQLLICLFNSS
jgi:hypothetical protein